MWIAIFSLISCFLRADQTPVLDRLNQSFDASIPTLKSVLGYDFGERITRHDQMERYLEVLQKSSGKLKLQKIGQSYEGRSLYYVLISSAENLAKLEELRAANLKLAEPGVTQASEAEAIIENNPVFVALSYAVHGNEHSSTEAALALAYYLLASTNSETAEILKNCVIIIDPLQNPDGRERFVSYFYSTVGVEPNQDPDAAEHNETWPTGRYNHYLFDMNRDWTVLSQQETRARVKAYQMYQPEIYIDVHEMTENSSYFFPPPTVPRNPNVPRSTIEWWNKLGKAISTEFDRHGIDYYSSERFDFWYPGYGDSWPTYNGALAGTFEQGSVRGLVRKRDDGKLIHYQDAVWHHFLSTRATCLLAASNREAKLRDFYEFRRSAVQEGTKGPVKHYLVSRTADPHSADRFVKNLLWQGVEIFQLQEDFQAVAHNYYNEEEGPVAFRKGDYVIRLDQPLKRLIEAILEKETLPDKEFLKQEEQRRREKEPTEFYDISAWSMPLAYGLDVYWSSDPLPASSAKISDIPEMKPLVESAPYAYIIDYNSNQCILAIQELLRRDVKIYFSEKPFRLDGRDFHAGSFIILTKGNGADLQQQIDEVAKRTGVSVHSSSTGSTERGPDLGSDDIRVLEKPRIAVLIHMPAAPTSAGATQFLLEQRYGFSYTPLQTYMTTYADLKKYNVIVMPDPSKDWGSYESILGKAGVDKLTDWVKSGGTLIALGGASVFLMGNKELTKLRPVSKFLKDSAEVAPEESEKEKSGQSLETEAPDEIPGAIARVKLNRKQFLAYGYSRDEIPVFVYSSNLLVATQGLQPAASYAEAGRLKISGLIWDLAAKRMENKVYLSEERFGSGHLILFAEDPTFRAYWEGLDRLFLNGILFGPSFH